MPDEAQFSATQPTHASAGRKPVYLETDNRGNLKVTLNGTGASAVVDTELPAAAALGDATANPTVPGVGTFVHGFNGTTWDRIRTRGTGILQVEEAYSFLNIAAGQATTTVKSGAGTFHTLVLNSAAAATNTTTIYDNTAASGTVIAIPAVTTATVPTTLIFDAIFGTGLTVITATANGGNMTFTYR